jgi:mxaD protein
MLESRALQNGAVAQLGERRVRNAKVEGSIPFRSTTQVTHEGQGMKNILRLLAGAALLLTATASFAAAPLLKVTKSVTIDAPVDQVWAKCGDFDALDRWHPAVAKDTLSKGRNNVPGAVRHLDIKGGGYVNEELTHYSSKGHSYSYKILDSVLPVSDYHSRLRVSAGADGKSVVTWTGTFKRKDTGPNPADNANDKAATDAISGVYQSGLDNLKQSLETK